MKLEHAIVHVPVERRMTIVSNDPYHGRWENDVVVINDLPQYGIHWLCRAMRTDYCDPAQWDDQTILRVDHEIGGGCVTITVDYRDNESGRLGQQVIVAYEPQQDRNQRELDGLLAAANDIAVKIAGYGRDEEELASALLAQLEDY